jgi:chromate transporter
LFRGFLLLGLMGFGGVLPLSRRAIVEEHHWLTPDEFVELLSLCQFLPGGNIINLSVAIGLRFRGVPGALACILGLIAAPTVIVIALGVLYGAFQDDPVIRHMFSGLAAAASALLISLAVKIVTPLKQNPAGIAIALACVIAIAVLKLPLLPTMLVLSVLSALATLITALVSLALIFTELSLLSFGGGNTILPEMQRQVVVVHHWMAADQFSAAFALAQAAPGPNMMIVSLIGWRIAGWSGLVVTTVATFGPSFVVTAITYNLWQRFKDRPWRRLVQAALVPVTAGLVCSSAVVITAGSATTVLLAGITAVSAALTLMTRAHPLAILAFGAVAGILTGSFG